MKYCFWLILFFLVDWIGLFGQINHSMMDSKGDYFEDNDSIVNLLKSNYSLNELEAMSQKGNTTLRCYVFKALLDIDHNAAFLSLKNNLEDSTYIKFKNGNYSTISNYFYLLWSEKSNDLKANRIIDSLVLYKNTAVWKGNILLKGVVECNIDEVKSMMFNEPTALLALRELDISLLLKQFEYKTLGHVFCGMLTINHFRDILLSKNIESQKNILESLNTSLTEDNPFNKLRSSNYSYTLNGFNKNYLTKDSIIKILDPSKQRTTLDQSLLLSLGAFNLREKVLLEIDSLAKESDLILDYDVRTLVGASLEELCILIHHYNAFVKCHVFRAISLKNKSVAKDIYYQYLRNDKTPIKIYFIEFMHGRDDYTTVDESCQVIYNIYSRNK